MSKINEKSEEIKIKIYDEKERLIHLKIIQELIGFIQELKVNTKGWSSSLSIRHEEFINKYKGMK